MLPRALSGRVVQSRPRHSRCTQYRDSGIEGCSLDKQVAILYLGDHNPSGLNISRVARKKIERFARRSIEWNRVALNSKQFDRMKNQFGIPVKRTDKLAPEYVSKYGNLCVEVDAIPSDEVRGLLETAITKRIDMEKWKETEETEGREQEEINRLVSEIRDR